MNHPIVRGLCSYGVCRQGFCGLALSVAVVGVFGLGGCAMPGKAPIQPASGSAEAAPQPKQTETKARAAEPAPDQKTLAAIEDFLSRTQQYRQSPPVVGAGTPPLMGSTPPAVSSAPPAVGASTAHQGREAGAIGARENAASQPNAPAANRLADGEPVRTPPKQAAANAELNAAEAPAPQPALPVPALERVTIQWHEESAADEAPVRANAANTPMTAAVSEREPSGRKLIDDLEGEAESRKDFESHWRWKLGQLALGRDTEAAETATQLPSDSAALLGAMVSATQAVRAAAADPLDEATAALAKIDELRNLVARQADPTVSGIALCRKVLTFGVYEEMPTEEFVSGRTIQLIVYSEIENFRSRKTDEEAYETRLATRLEVFTKAGELVWQRDEPEVIDACRNLRRDFFVAQRVTLPPTLPAGDYVLKVRVEDKLAAKAGEAVKPFAIHSPISVAKKP